MERKENKPQASGICSRLFNFVVDGLLFRGLKRVTLGRPVESNMVSGRSSNTAGHNEGCCVGATKPTEESGTHNHLAYGTSDTKESLVERANKLYRSSPIATIGSSIRVQKNGVDEVPDDEFFEVQSPSLKVIPVGGTQNGVKEVTASAINGQGRNSVRFKQPNVQDSQMVENPSSSSQITSSQQNAQGGAKGEMEKNKGKEVSKKEKQIPSPVPENDVKVRATTPVIPIINGAFDIDRRSAELIERTKNALKNSA